MNNYSNILILLIILLLNKIRCEEHRKVLVIGLDGFRCEYLNRKNYIPNISKFVKEGIRAKCMIASYATLTFPNFYTLATGKYEEEHGILNNKLPVANSNKSISLLAKQEETRSFYTSKTIWAAAREEGKKVGVMFWPGSQMSPLDASKRNKSMQLPHIYQYKYSDNMPFEERVYGVHSWFTDLNLDLGYLYFNEPDHTGHVSGPDSPEMNKMLQKVDSAIKMLVDLFRSSEKTKNINIIIISDHGMAEGRNQIKLKEYLDLEDLKYKDLPQTISSHIYPKDGAYDNVLEAVKSIPNITVYEKKDIPKEFHFANHSRTPPILLIPDMGFYITIKNYSKSYTPYVGHHGYPPHIEEMKSIFLANGPAFNLKSNRSVEFPNVE
ncbi:hypothetical protein SNEBB_007244, partial [Seison nebaliae]